MLRFCETVLKLSIGESQGKPFVPEPSQRFILGSIFGWKLAATGTRRFRRVYIETAKGSGKSPVAAAVGLYCMVADGESGAQVYSAASQKAQARVVFDFAVRMREQSPALRAALVPTGKLLIQNLAHMKSGSYFRPVSLDEGKLSGPMPSCVICDELHEHKTGEVIEMMERGFKSRTQPLLFMITNSGSDRQSVCYQEHQHAVRVAAGTRTPDAKGTYVGEVIDDATFSFVCSLDLGDDPLEDESCWIKANPLLGVTFPIAEMRRAVAQAKTIPGKLNNILRLHCGVWTESVTAWMTQPTLDACLDEFDPAEHEGASVYMGADLSGSQDLTALGFVVPTGMVERLTEEGEVKLLPTYDAWVEAWTPLDTLAERALRDQAPYDVWVKQGWLNAPPGKQIRLDFVAARIAEVNADYRIETLAYDRYSYRKLEEEIDAQGVTIRQVEHPQGGKRRAKVPDEEIEEARRDKREVPQGLWMPGSVVALEELILDGRIRLRRSPVLISACMSAVTEADPFDNRWFSKRKATNRIDPLVALAMAVGAAVAGMPQQRSIEIAAMIV